MYTAAATIYYASGVWSYFGKATENRTLLLPAFYPFDYHSSPVFESICVIQCIQSSALIIADSVSQCLLVALVKKLTDDKIEKKKIAASTFFEFFL